MSRNILDKDKQLEADVSRLHRLVMTLGRRKSLRDPISNICEDRQFTPSQVHTLIWLGEDGPL
ncbi:MAG TPA: MarR family transcriptional regulator, partial [Myxococcaceae bacterium]|nr:MarR family transcriptional regulator [Myxococcaceae bacterium]